MITVTRKEISSATLRSKPLHFTAKAKDLLSALLPIGSVAPSRSPRPILSHFKIAVTSKDIEASATDLEMWVTASVDLTKSAGEGTFALPAEAFLQILKEAGEGEASVSVGEGGAVLVEVGKDCYEVSCLPADEFPPCSEGLEEPCWTLAGGTLPRLLRRTAFAAARERTRYTLNGVYWYVEDGRVEVVATDGRRLALARASVKGADKATGILPLRTVSQMGQFGDQAVTLAMGERAVEVRTVATRPAHTLVSRLLDGQYPNYQSVIPKDYPNIAIASAPDLLAAFRRAALLSQESRAVRLVFRKGGLTLTGGDPGRGQAKIEVDLDYQGTEVDLRLNPDFIMEGLKTWGDQPVRWEIRDAVSPCVLKEGDDYLYVVLPITLE
jgi:DNA polymerase-3 subunit beta